MEDRGPRSPRAGHGQARGAGRGTPRPGRPASRSGQRNVAARGRVPSTPAAPGSTGRPIRATAVRRPRLTGRAAILILLLAVLTVSYASSLRAYLQQRAHIADLKAEIAEKSASIDKLELEKKRWKDPEYVQQQARERFGFVFPGETPYVVVDENGNPLDESGALRDPAPPDPQVPTAWWSTAWQSVELAGSGQ